MDTAERHHREAPSPCLEAEPEGGTACPADNGSPGWQRHWAAPVAAAFVLLALAAIVSRERWLPALSRVAMAARSHQVQPASVGGPVADRDEHNHVAEGVSADEASSLVLSEQGRKNVGLTLATVELRNFERTVSIPAVLVDRPGRTTIAVSAPMTGIVRRIFPLRGAAVSPGEPLFDLRLTHEDLVEKQSALLRALEELDVVKREVTRLEKLSVGGAVAGKRLLERQYEQQKIEAIVRAEQQALVLHGLTEKQIASIVKDRQLLQAVTVLAPSVTSSQPCCSHEEYLQVTDLSVTAGEHVTAGTRLCRLSDHCELYIEGKAFEQDADALNEAANQGAPITAIVEGNGTGPHRVTQLRILYVENQVEMESRALKFYVRLPNELVRNEKTADGNRFIGWRYRPGQRVEVLVPLERWKDRIVLPLCAVIQEGAETYVYQQIGHRFERKPVHVEYRDQQWAVLESDGTLFPGDTVAANGAYQIHLALKNKAGGGPDPHAGHQH